MIGFATGYSAGERHAQPAVQAQAFSEATVIEPPPAPVDPQPVVVEDPEPVAAPDPPVVRSSRPATGSINVISRPAGAQVILDGRVVGRTPLSISDVSAGPHRVRLQLPTYSRWETSIDVNGGARTRVAASLEQP